jgi:hypothetical protein
MRFLTVQEIRSVGAVSCGPRLAPLMAALLDLEAADPAISDPDLTADLGSGYVDVELMVSADDPVAAMSKALAAVRSAVRAIGEWETGMATMRVGPVDAPDTLLTAA